MSSPSNFHLTTPRLFISHHNPLNTSHLDLNVNLLRSPSSLRFNPNGPSIVSDRTAAAAFIEKTLPRMLETGYGRYIVSLRPPNNEDEATSIPFSERQDLAFIGVVTMQLQRIPTVPGPLIPDVGFNILPEFHGKGYAREAATHLMEYFRKEKGVKAFAGITDEGNEEAKRVLGKLGFREWGVRRVRGVTGDGGEEEVSVWTVGVDDAGALGELRL